MLLELLKIALVKRIAELLFIQRRVLNHNGSQRSLGRLLSFLQRLRSEILERRFEVPEIPTSPHQRSLALFAERNGETVCSPVVAGAVLTDAAQLPVHVGIMDRYDLRYEIGRRHCQNLGARKLEWTVVDRLRGRFLLHLSLCLRLALSKHRKCGAESDDGKNRQAQARENHLLRNVAPTRPWRLARFVSFHKSKFPEKSPRCGNGILASDVPRKI